MEGNDLEDLDLEGDHQEFYEIVYGFEWGGNLEDLRWEDLDVERNLGHLRLEEALGGEGYENRLLVLRQRLLERYFRTMEIKMREERRLNEEVLPERDEIKTIRHFVPHSEALPTGAHIKKQFAVKTGKVFSLDLHPFQPWILASFVSGRVSIYNYEAKEILISSVVAELTVRCSKFIARKQWFVAGADDLFIRVYNYNMDEVTTYEAHTGYIRCVAVHPSLSYVLSSSDDMLIKLWDWERDWTCTQVFDGHSDAVLHCIFNPKDTNTFASASLDHTVKIWNLGSAAGNFTLHAHSKGVNCVDYFIGSEKTYLITGSDDHTAKIWDYETTRCIQTLEGHTDIVSSVCFHPMLPIIITGSSDGTVRTWDASTYRLQKTVNYTGLEQVQAFAYARDSHCVAIGYVNGIILTKIGQEVPLASMDFTGKILLAQHNIIHAANPGAFRVRQRGLRQGVIPPDVQVTDGEPLTLVKKEMKPCDISLQCLKHSPDGKFVVVCGDGQFVIYTARDFRKVPFDGFGLEFVWSWTGEFAVRESPLMIKIFSRNFQLKKTVLVKFSVERIFGGMLLGICSSNFFYFYDWTEGTYIQRIDLNVNNIYWESSGDFLVISSWRSFSTYKYNRYRKPIRKTKNPNSENEAGEEFDEFELLDEKEELVISGMWVFDCFIYINSSLQLKCSIGGEVTTLFNLDRRMHLLGYGLRRGWLYLIDTELNVVGYHISCYPIIFKSLVMRSDANVSRGSSKFANRWKYVIVNCLYGKTEAISDLTLDDLEAKALNLTPCELLDSLAYFLEARGMLDRALDVARSPDAIFDLAMKTKKLLIAEGVAVFVSSKFKWKQLGELATTQDALLLARTCLERALNSTNDLSGLLLFYSWTKETHKIENLASRAKSQGNINVAFQCLFKLRQLDECFKLLIESNRKPEAYSMAQFHFPNNLPEKLVSWQNDPSKEITEYLVDHQEDPNLFADWGVALMVESDIGERRYTYIPDTDYLSDVEIDFDVVFSRLVFEE